ncbi:alpha-(1-_3)-arabinofuranosyltransferase domain-containing protein [Streptomyces sp. SS162]|uniref:alpha-(1->3)-arabinofuranosyltransferase domain-containing protein n=1 Tax=Streptomyces sp. SS162 TaxID=3108484 RepID=UPI002F417687
MTTTLQAPTGVPRPPGPTPPEASGEPRGRRLLFGFWAVVLAAFLAVSPGRMTFETKLGVALDPWRFLSDLGSLWNGNVGLGGIANQYVGYAFPALPYYALMDLLHVPVWLAERLWLSVIVTAAFWGALRLAERLRVGTPATRVLAAAVYALWPTFTIVVGSTSAAALPGAVLPWVLLPLTCAARSPRTAAARSALLIPFMGGVNAASTLAALLPVGLYLLSRPPGRRRRALLGWWIPGVVLATVWWVVPLLLMGVHGENFMPYVEQADTTTATMSATELLRGAGNWVAYLNFGEAWLPAGWTVAAVAVAVAGSAFAAALGLAGLARRDLPERRWLLLTVLAVALVTLAGYGGALGGPFHGVVQDWLDGALKPFRNIYKFQPGLALALALGVAHLTGVLSPRRGYRALRGRRWVPAAAAVLVLPGLALPYVNGSILQPGAFTRLPAHWEKAAGWLKDNAPDSRALVVPATAHGIYTWGSPIDQPFDVLAETPWAQRDFVPFGTPGARRMTDAVEQALLSGTEVPGLRAYLARAGVHEVVVRNDLDPDQIGYVPPQTVKRTLESSGYRKVAGFGPLVTGGRIAADTPLQVQALYPRLQAVEIYRPRGGEERPGRVGVAAVEDTAVVSGGPEALLRLSADSSMAGRPAVLAGDRLPEGLVPPVKAVADGLRRADTRFGLVNNNTSYTYTADERNHPGSLQNPGEEPHQILPRRGAEHQTTAVLRGARAVTASSSGSWLFHLPQYDPVHAFDGNPDTAWAEGSPGEPAGQWLRVEFSRPTDVPASLQLTPLPGDGVRAAPTRVRIETERGFADSPLRTDGQPQTVKAPSGETSWLKVTVLAAQLARPGLSGAGFSEVSIPDVQVTRMLVLPADAQRTDAAASVYSVHRGTDAGGLSPASAEAGLHRRFSTGEPGEYRVSARAVAVPGGPLDELLDRSAPGPRDRVTATADSTSRDGRSLSARNLVDGDLTTAWIAGDRPVVHLSWPGRRKVDEIILVPAGGVSTRPEQVTITSPHGAAVADVDENGRVRFPEIETDRLDVTVSRAAPLTLHNPVADAQLQLPVGLSEVHVPALADLLVPRPEPSARFSLPCGQGPDLAVGGVLHKTKASGLVRDLTERRPVSVSLCAGEEADGTLELPPGEHELEAGDAGPLAITDVTLTTGTPRALAGAADREVKVTGWSGDRRTVTVSAGSGGAAYLRVYENANDGWKATLDGAELEPVRLDGWQQAWVVPAGASGTVTLEFEPSGTYRAGLIGGAFALAALAALAFAGRRRDDGTTGGELPEPAAPGMLLGTLALTAVVAVAAGWLALVVPVLAVAARLRPGVLVPVAAAAMAAAGLVAAVGAGEPVAAGEGAFSGLAQALAVLALSAALVTAAPAATGRTATAGKGDGGSPAPQTGPAPAAEPAIAAGPVVTAAPVTPAGPVSSARPASAGDAERPEPPRRRPDGGGPS